MLNFLIFFLKLENQSSKHIVNNDSLLSKLKKELISLQNEVNLRSGELDSLRNELKKFEDGFTIIGLPYSHIFLIGFILLFILVIILFYLNYKKIEILKLHQSNTKDNRKTPYFNYIEECRKNLSSFEAKFQTINSELNSVKSQVENLQKNIVEINALALIDPKLNKDLNLNNVGMQDYQFISNININNNRISKTKSNSFYILLKRDNKYYISISDQVLNSEPTMEYSSKIKDYFNLIVKPYAKQYKLKEPTALLSYNEETGEFQIEKKGEVEYA